MVRVAANRFGYHAEKGDTTSVLTGMATTAPRTKWIRICYAQLDRSIRIPGQDASGFTKRPPKDSVPTETADREAEDKSIMSLVLRNRSRTT